MFTAAHQASQRGQDQAAAMAAGIPKAALIEVADKIGVKARRGEWFLPESCP